jgi:hypothetical protein
VKVYLKAVAPRSHVEPVERIETPAGQQSQQDWSEYRLPFGTVQAFSYVLAYSRRQYAEMMESLDFFSMIRAHVRAFEYFGGVTRECLYDNQKTVVLRWEYGRPIYNTKFLAFATHYGFRPRALPPRRPELKGKVERPFLYLETSFFNCRTFRDRDDLNAQLATWLRQTSDTRVHRTTRRRPIDLFGEERPHLLPLPTCPYDTAQVVYRIASVDGYVGWDGNEYSVPPEYITQPLVVRALEKTLVVYSPDVRRLTEHELRPPGLGERSGKPEHKITHRDDERRRNRELLESAFRELGPGAPDFIQGLKRVQARQVGHHLASILELKRRYAVDDIVIAIQHALRYHAFDARSIERVLAAQAAERTLEEPFTALFRGELARWLAENPLSTRRLDVYQALLTTAGRGVTTELPEQEERDDSERDRPEGAQGTATGSLRRDPGSRT